MRAVAQEAQIEHGIYIRMVQWAEQLHKYISCALIGRQIFEGDTICGQRQQRQQAIRAYLKESWKGDSIYGIWPGHHSCLPTHRWPETSSCHAASQSHPDEQSPRIAHWRSVSIPVLHSVRVLVVPVRVDCARQSHCHCPVPSTGTWCWVCKTRQAALVVVPSTVQ